MISKAEIASLVKMAEKYDEEGDTEAAKQLDITIAKLVQAAKDEEKEESGPKITGAQVRAIKAMRKAAQQCEKAFSRGAPRGACRKLDDLAEQVLAACVECDFLD